MKKSLLIFATILCCRAWSAATEWHVLGPRAMGMGGAGVALPQGPQSAYWNPSALGVDDNPSGVQVPVGAHLGVTGPVLRGANDLNQVAEDCAIGPTTGSCSQTNITNALNLMNDPNNGVRGDVGAGAGVKVGRMSVFANNLTYVGAKPFVDTTANITPGTVISNLSSLQLRGISVTEIGVGYGHELPFASGLFAGAALKAMIGRVGYRSISVISDDPGGSGGLDEFLKGSKSSFAPGLDLGLLWDINRTFGGEWLRPRVGLTARNVNNPRFKNPDAARAAGLPDKYSVHGAMRMGVAISPFKFWNIAADADLTRNLTTVEGVKSQVLGLGTEINVFNRTWLNIPLRAGLSKNIANSGSKTGLSLGAGLNFLHFNFDIGATVTPGSETVQSQGETKKVPNEAAVSAQFAVLFGGGPAKTE